MMWHVTKDEINSKLDQHEAWLKNKSFGRLASFCNGDLSGADLSFRDLSAAWFNDTRLVGANLGG